MSEPGQTTKEKLRQAIRNAAGKLQSTWPLYSYVTSNPLAGYEDRPFRKAVPRIRNRFGARGYPSADQFRQAWENGWIDREKVKSQLYSEGYEISPETALSRLEQEESLQTSRNGLGSETERFINKILSKWLSVFLDEGRSSWSMPGRQQGFYRAWSNLAPHDHELPDAHKLKELPEDKFGAISSVFEREPRSSFEEVFAHHLAQLPGWVGYIKHRSNRTTGEWSSRHPIDLADYLGVRLLLADHLDGTVVPENDFSEPAGHQHDPLRRCFLNAWEQTYQGKLLNKLSTGPPESGSPASRPDAQFVFCIDTRSEVIRRQIEATGNYETHGYAGFFGVPVRRQRYGSDTQTDACPPIVDPEHAVRDEPFTPEQEEKLADYLSSSALSSAAKNALQTLKNNLPGAFSFVELTGILYGLGLIENTFLPGKNLLPTTGLTENSPDYDEVFRPSYETGSTGSGQQLEQGLPLESRIDYAEDAFRLMGWEHFAPVVVFAGHVSDTTNNPFDSSLKCGACAGNSGVPNARILARICNEDVVRDGLRERGIEIPDDTVFVPARHNTTTDEVDLLEQDLGESPDLNLASIRDDLQTARKKATDERAHSLPGGDAESGPQETDARSSDWAQTRPEWGLAGNAAFVVGSNDLRKEVNLNGRVFLHSYNWRTDDDGSALEQIIAGPLVVCQWINHQYYFSTVDNGAFGSGSKITHNPVGNFGVYQGNGGDLMGGLPLESLMRSDEEMQHRPIRITNIIQAPVSRVRHVLQQLESVQQLIEHNWINLVVVDPTRGNELIRYHELPGEDEASRSREPLLPQTTL